jgi:hypothetical protein
MARQLPPAGPARPGRGRQEERIDPPAILEDVEDRPDSFVDE